eukprot:286045-Amorphochlora_amoeboformis.AAC.1
MCCANGDISEVLCIILVYNLFHSLFSLFVPCAILANFGTIRALRPAVPSSFGPNANRRLPPMPIKARIEKWVETNDGAYKGEIFDKVRGFV